MNINKKSKDLTPQEIYFLTMSPSVQKMMDAKGQVIEVASWCIYNDTNSKGEEHTILSICTTEKEVLATNSPTFIADFEKMWSMFDECGEKVNAIKVISGTSKTGREFITCQYER